MGWPEDLPLPLGARLLGSLVHSFGDSSNGHLEAVLDAAGNATTVLSSYGTELGSHGWVVFEEPSVPRAGFVSDESETGERRSFLRGDLGPVLTVTVVRRDDLPCDVRLGLDANVRRSPPHRGGSLSSVLERIPTLRAPAHVSVARSGGGGGSDRDWTTHSTARTQLAVGELEAYFESQLSESGWTRLGRGDDGVVAWSSWQLPGESGWKGMLLVHAAFVEDERSLILRVEAQAGGGNVLFSTAPLDPS